jgi:CheY-like chemotaxis protein
MGKQILMIDSDLRFAEETKSGFGSFGATVEIAADGPSGLERALSNRPDLIFLTIELTGMNGFLVCKKIKKAPELTEVPLVILSSDASDETFDQHKKLKTHAEGYLHKPITVEKLVDQARQLIDLETDEIIVDQEPIELKPDDIIMESDTAPPLLDDDDASSEIDIFQPLSEPELEPEPEPVPEPVAVPQFFPDPEPIAAPLSVSIGSMQRPAGVFPTPARRTPVPPAPMSLTGATDEINLLYHELESTRQQLSAAEAALRETRSIRPRDSGISGREFLDLRERLNRKDRELLDLRDQITARDKQLVEANDNILRVARELEDAKDRGHTLEIELEKENNLVESLNAEKELAQKRIEDLRNRLERTDTKKKEKESELEQLEIRRTKEIEDLKQEMERRSAEEAESRHAALEELRVTLQSDAAEKLREAEEQYQREIASSEVAREKEINRLREQLTTLAAESDAQREGLEARYTAEIKSRDQEHLQEMAQLNRTLFETENKATEAQEKLEKLQETETSLNEALKTITADRDAKESDLAASRTMHQEELERINRESTDKISALDERAGSLERSLASAQQKLDSDRVSFERIRESLVSGLSIIDQREQS